MKISLLVLPLVLLASVHAVAKEVSSMTDDQVVAAVEASNKKRGATAFWRSDSLGLIFGYDERWKPGNPSQKSTAALVNWKSSKSGSPMAACYLEVNNSEIGKLKPDEIRQKAHKIVDAFMRNGRLRDPNMQLLTWRLASQDNHPVVYIERDMSVTNINKTIRTRIYSVVTSWQGREVNLECSSSIAATMPMLAGVVEGPIKTVLGSMQFVRAVQ